ncbi:hypothetical protein COW53_00365 [bacterium CG17_big_fil_post_rev_8_21_14_2_50_64_8]|nr:MAG: hypothetical protein COW53_00365 [bacterium CG17_big_fil_post_rev_8_21_14_2_50_64_8]
MVHRIPNPGIDFARVHNAVRTAAKSYRRRVGRHVDASIIEDLEQEVCVILWRKHLRGELASAVERSSNLEGYVKLTIKRQAWLMLARYRKESRAPVDATRLNTRFSTPETALHFKQVLRGVDALSPERRMAVRAAIARETDPRKERLSPAERQNLGRARADLEALR